MYVLEISEEDKNALLNVINMANIKGADAEYIIDLKKRIANAPIKQEKK
jgi:hypothetical protein